MAQEIAECGLRIEHTGTRRERRKSIRGHEPNAIADRRAARLRPRNQKPTPKNIFDQLSIASVEPEFFLPPRSSAVGTVVFVPTAEDAEVRADSVALGPSTPRSLPYRKAERRLKKLQEEAQKPNLKPKQTFFAFDFFWILGTVIYIIRDFLFLRGRPTDSGRRRRPRRRSHLDSNESPASGRPRFVAARKASIHSSWVLFPSIFFHLAPQTLRPFPSCIVKRPDASSPPQCAAALLNGYFHASRCIRARTGLRSI